MKCSRCGSTMVSDVGEEKRRFSLYNMLYTCYRCPKCGAQGSGEKASVVVTPGFHISCNLPEGTS